MSDKYASLSPYVYCADNPLKLVDPNGEEVVDNPYIIFNGAEGILQIFDDSNTPDDFTDDHFIGEFEAHNNVDRKSKGKWEDGAYPFEDTTEPHTHGELCDKNGVKLDSPNGAYGEQGIFRVKPFTEKTTGIIRIGMGVHAGREHKKFKERLTNGCIRTTAEAIKAMIKAIEDYGPMRTIYVQNNRPSPESAMVNAIKPIKQYISRIVDINP